MKNALFLKSALLLVLEVLLWVPLVMIENTEPAPVGRTS